MITTSLSSFYRQPLKKYRQRLFARIIGELPYKNVEIIYLTHLLPDRIELVDAISKIVKIRKIVAIPYSIDKKVFDLLSTDHEVVCPTLNDLMDEKFLKSLLSDFGHVEFMIVEIGGYFSVLGNWLADNFGNLFLGVLESTESGHRRYLELENPRFPIWSIARSSGKMIEDTQVGASSVYATERYLRSLGLVLSGTSCLVVGYGKVGRDLAHTLRARGCTVFVFDIDPLQRLMALGEGFAVPVLPAALKRVQIVFGATGTTCLSVGQICECKSGALLVSCTSKNIEFDVAGLRRDGRLISKTDECEQYFVGDRAIHLLAAGQPANFLYGGVIGPLLSLVHAELLSALAFAANGKAEFGLRELDLITEKAIADCWIEEFIDPENGVCILMPDVSAVDVTTFEAMK